jgi:hypothetical protein
VKVTSPQLLLLVFVIAAIVAVVLGYTNVGIGFLALGIIIPALQIYLENQPRLVVRIELKKKEVRSSDIISRERSRFYDLIIWENLSEGQQRRLEQDKINGILRFSSIEAVKEETDVICIKVANRGLKEVNFEKVFILFDSGRLELKPSPETVLVGKGENDYFYQRQVFTYHNPGTSASEFVDELRQKRGADTVPATAYATISGKTPCRLERGDSSGCKVWIDAVFVAVWLDDHHHRDVTEIRASFVTGAEDSFESDSLPFDVGKSADAVKWLDSLTSGE